MAKRIAALIVGSEDLETSSISLYVDSALYSLCPAHVQKDIDSVDLAVLIIPDGKPRIIKAPTSSKRERAAETIAAERFSEIQIDAPKRRPIESEPSILPTQAELQRTRPASQGALWERFEMTGGGHYKFWEVKVRGSELCTRWGRIGTEGFLTVKDCLDPWSAEKEKTRLINSKLVKGYRRKSDPSR